MTEISDTGLARYLREIAEYPLLTAEEEVQLSQQLREGRCAERRLARLRGSDSAERAQLEERVALGRQARERLVASNLRLVVTIARRYRGHGLSLMDLIQEGNIGLQTGVEKYDWRKGYRLSTYIFWWIRQAMTRALANDSRVIRLPVHSGELVRRAAQVERDLELELGRAPSPAEVAARARIALERLQSLRQAASSPVSLDAPLASDSELSRADTIADGSADADLETAVEASELHQRFAAVLAKLPEREREVLELHYGLNQSGSYNLAEVGHRLGVTRERARQIESQALRRLRADRHLKRELLDLASA